MDSFFVSTDKCYNPETPRSGGEGARGPGDLGFAPTEAKRRPNPPLATCEKITETLKNKASVFLLHENFGYTLLHESLCNIWKYILKFTVSLGWDTIEVHKLEFSVLT